MLTASALPRARRCLASIAHPQADFRTRDADDGNARHKVDEDAINDGDLSTLPVAVADDIAGMVVRSEVALSLNAATRTAKVLGYGIGRSYGALDPFETPGTCDLLAVSPEGAPPRVVIGDRKGYEEVDHPSENWQTLLYAAAAAIVFGVSEVTVWIYGAIGQPRMAVLERVELDAYVSDLEQLHIRAAAAKQNPKNYEVPGDHCNYCHALEPCSKFRALLVAVDRGSADRKLSGLLSLDDDETAGWFYLFAEQLAQLKKRVDARLYARAAERPIPVPGTDKVFGKRLKPGNRQLDADKTVTAIREILGLDAERAAKFEKVAIERSTSQAAIERAAKEVAHKGGISSLKERIVKRVDELGGVTRGKTTESFEEYEPIEQLRSAADG
jgi:hypothetical protein